MAFVTAILWRVGPPRPCSLRMVSLRCRPCPLLCVGGMCRVVWCRPCVGYFGIGTMTGASMFQCLIRDGAGVAMTDSPHCSGWSMAEPHLPYRCQMFLDYFDAGDLLTPFGRELPFDFAYRLSTCCSLMLTHTLEPFGVSLGNANASSSLRCACDPGH